jgi:hypothetical protein
VYLNTDTLFKVAMKFDGVEVGAEVGAFVGLADGELVGLALLGDAVGLLDGVREGALVGHVDGSRLGPETVGEADGPYTSCTTTQPCLLLVPHSGEHELKYGELAPAQTPAVLEAAAELV